MPPKQAPKPVSKSISAIPVTTKGVRDNRYHSAQPLKMNGTKDQRYKK